MTVKTISFLLYILINFLIIQPSLVLCEERDLKIFGIKVGEIKQDSPLSSGQKIGYTILDWVLSGLVAIAIILVLACICCGIICCSRRGNRRNTENDLGIEEEDTGIERFMRDLGNERSEGNDSNEGNEGNEENEENEKNVKSVEDEENDGKTHAR